MTQDGILSEICPLVNEIDKLSALSQHDLGIMAFPLWFTQSTYKDIFLLRLIVLNTVNDWRITLKFVQSIRLVI